MGFAVSQKRGMKTPQKGLQHFPSRSYKLVHAYDMFTANAEDLSKHLLYKITQRHLKLIKLDKHV